MCKVDVATERYDLAAPTEEYDSLDAYLLSRWTGADGGESEGYKSLTAWFNRRLLARVYEDHGRDATDVRLDAEYEALVGDDDIAAADVAADLEADGIDADEVTRAMVSWSTMRRHLNECLDGEKPRETATSDWERTSVDIATRRVREKAREALDALGSKGRLAGASTADVDVQVRVACDECLTRVPLEDAIDRGYVCQEHDLTPDEGTGEVSALPDGGSDSSRLPGIVPLGSLSSATLLLGDVASGTIELAGTIGIV